MEGIVTRLLPFAAHGKCDETAGLKMVVKRQHAAAFCRVVGGGYNLCYIGAQGKTAVNRSRQAFRRVGAEGVVIRQYHLAAIVHGKIHQPLELRPGEIHVDIDIIGAGNDGCA